MASFNKVILVGNLTADPELKQTPTGISVCRFSIAVQRRFARSGDQNGQQPTADFFNIVAWRQSAEFVARYFKKGRPILVCGQLQNRNWTDPQGVKHYATDIVADEVSFVDSNRSSESAGTDNQSQYTPDAYGSNASSNAGGNNAAFEEMQGDESLPF
ncbi:MAG: single-stranded DNA-binding protein [Clostridia bacterium]|nr:single-stranded DNA-binding protein [Clostridia bacterium]